MRELGTDSVIDVRPKLRPAPSVTGAGLSQSTVGGFAALRVDLRSIEDRLAALRDRLETLVQTDELSQHQAPATQAAPAQQVQMPVQSRPVHPHAAQVQPQPVHVQPQPVQARPQPPQAQPEPRPAAAKPQYPSHAAPQAQQRVTRSSSPALSAMHLLRSNRRQQVTLPRPLQWSNGTRPGDVPAPVNGVPTNGFPANGVPMNGVATHGVPMNGLPTNGAPMNGGAANGTPVSGGHTNDVPRIFPHGAPIITAGSPAARVMYGAGAVPALPVTNGIPAQPTTKLPTLADVRPAGRAEPAWIGTALRRLAPADREAAGRAIVGLLPIQGDVIPDDVAYDLVISDGAYAVTVTEEEVAIQRIPIPRPLASIDGRIEMTLEGLGALPTTKRQRALLRSGSVRVSGRHGKRALAALHQVAVAPVGLRRACDAGVTLPEDVLMSLVAAAIPPEWTIGHRFTIGVETSNGTAEPHARLFLRVNDGGNVAVNQGLPLDIPTATIRCAREQLAQILLGAAPEDATLAGDRAPIMLLQGWVSRLESGRV